MPGASAQLPVLTGCSGVLTLELPLVPTREGTGECGPPRSAPQAAWGRLRVGPARGGRCCLPAPQSSSRSLRELPDAPLPFESPEAPNVQVPRAVHPTGQTGVAHPQ